MRLAILLEGRFWADFPRTSRDATLDKVQLMLDKCTVVAEIIAELICFESAVCICNGN